MKSEVPYEASQIGEMFHLRTGVLFFIKTQPRHERDVFDRRFFHLCKQQLFLMYTFDLIFCPGS